jgi:hypothetical protein
LCILSPDTLLKNKAPLWQIKSRPHALQREDGPKENLFSAPVISTGQVELFSSPAAPYLWKLVPCLK